MLRGGYGSLVATIARPSAASLYIEMTHRGQVLGSGTAFVVQKNGMAHLVTNWHNVAGRRPDTNELLSQTGAVPDAIKIFHNRAGQLVQWIETVQELYDPGGNALWLEHPQPRAAR